MSKNDLFECKPGECRMSKVSDVIKNDLFGHLQKQHINGLRQRSGARDYSSTVSADWLPKRFILAASLRCDSSLRK